MADDTDVFASKLGSYIELTEADKETLGRFTARAVRFDAGEDILTEGEPNDTVYLLRAGWAIRYKLLPDGRRQVIAYLLPGDLFGFKESLFDMSDDSIQALTDMTVHPVPAAELLDLPERHPRLALALTWARMRESSILAEQIVRLGRRSAYERLAHLIMELLHRLQLVGLASERAYGLPLTQEVLADTLGLSIVHVNRTLRRLRKEGLVSIDTESRRVRIEDLRGLARAGQYDETFLDQLGEPAPDPVGAIAG